MLIRVLIIILVLLILLLFARVGFRLRHNGDRTLLSLQLCGLTVFRLDLDKLVQRTRQKISTPARPARPEPEKPPEEGQSTRDLISALGGISEIIAMVREGLTTATERLLKKIVFHRMLLDLTVGGPDPMQTTLLYGLLSATVFPAAAWITQTFTVHHYSVTIQPDHALQQPEARLDLQVWMRVFRIPHTAIGLLPLIRRVLTALRSPQLPQTGPNQEVKQETGQQ